MKVQIWGVREAYMGTRSCRFQPKPVFERAPCRTGPEQDNTGWRESRIPLLVF